MLHFHVRDPKTGQGSSNFDQYNDLLERVRQAVPKMIIQVGGSIAFAPIRRTAKAKWLDYDTRHMLTELNPKPESVTVAIGTTLVGHHADVDPRRRGGTHLEDPKVDAAPGPACSPTRRPAFYLEHLKRLRTNGIQPFFTLAHVHQLEIVERLIRHGVYMGPLNTNIIGYGGGACGHNPFDWMQLAPPPAAGCRSSRSGAACGATRGRPALGHHPGPTCGSASRTISGTASASA